MRLFGSWHTMESVALEHQNIMNDGPYTSTLTSVKEPVKPQGAAVLYYAKIQFMFLFSRVKLPCK